VIRGYAVIFGSGITGYAIWMSLEQHNRWRSKLDQIVETVQKKKSPPTPATREWKKGDRFEIDGIGDGEYLVPDANDGRMSWIKIGDSVPCLFPTSRLQPRKKRNPMPQSGRPWQRVREFGQDGAPL